MPPALRDVPQTQVDNPWRPEFISWYPKCFSWPVSCVFVWIAFPLLEEVNDIVSASFTIVKLLDFQIQGVFCLRNACLMSWIVWKYMEIRLDIWFEYYNGGVTTDCTAVIEWIGGNGDGTGWIGGNSEDNHQFINKIVSLTTFDERHPSTGFIGEFLDGRSPSLATVRHSTSLPRPDRSPARF
jgi:hypothetical protein